MNFVFRTDASITIGNGHAMRCLTLATELTQLVIEDLVNRQHRYNILLDKKLCGLSTNCEGLIKPDLDGTIGPQFAPLPRRFARSRPIWRARRSSHKRTHLLFCTGRANSKGTTKKIIGAIKQPNLPSAIKVNVSTNLRVPHRALVIAGEKSVPWIKKIITGVSNMDKLLTNRGTAIGATGAAAREHSCIALHTIMVSLPTVD